MTSTYSDSAYGKLRAAEVFAEEGKLIEAAEAYKHAFVMTPTPACGFAEYGITLLRQQKPAAAREEFEYELQTHSLLRAGDSRPCDRGCSLRKPGRRTW